ncbi:MAG: hypothetical protein ACI398_10765 [Clostridium sp.]
MKNLLRIVIWTLAALIIQHGAFLYLENVYLATDYEIKAEKVEDENDKPEEKEEIMIKDGVENLALSHNGRFVAYMDNGRLKIFDSQENKENEFTPDNKGEVVFYKWLTEGNNMMVIQKVIKNGYLYYEPISYEAKKNIAANVVDFDYNELRIPVKSEDEFIENMEFSTATSTFYIKIKKGNGRSDLYSWNIMNQLDCVRTDKYIGDIVVPTTNSNCVMEMGDDVTILGSSDNIKIPGVTKARVLGADINDYVYFGEECDGYITKICYSMLSDEQLKWNVLTLSKAVEKNDICIDYSGKIYIDDRNNNLVTELTSGKTIKYDGEFVQVYSDGIISRVGNRLIKNQLEPKNLSNQNNKTIK